MSFSDVYNGLKDLISLAKKIKNQEIVELSLQLQEQFFELREDNENLNNKIKDLSEEIKNLKKAKVKEKDLEYNPRGFFTIKGEQPKIPYCSCCWKKDSKLIPLSQYGNWWNYKCGNCNSEVSVMDDKGNPLNQQGENNG